MSYWLPGQIKDSTLDHARAAKDDHPSNDMMEDEPQGNPGIQVSNLMKIFRSLTGEMKLSLALNFEILRSNGTFLCSASFRSSIHCR